MMRLLYIDQEGNLVLRSFAKGREPPYAILSHTWGSEEDEVTFDDLLNGTAEQKPGYAKLEFCKAKAKSHDLDYFWIDSCCINRANQNELTTAINSMFTWYRRAWRCYVYLSDVSVVTENGELHNAWEIAFRNSRWFTRGWTLQELLAPRIVEFYSRQGLLLGDKRSLEELVHETTGIPTEALRNCSLAQYSIETRLSWAKQRDTSIEEDRAYCLLGICGVFMTLIYGEGHESAMMRLRREILAVGDENQRTTRRQRGSGSVKIVNSWSHTLVMWLGMPLVVTLLAVVGLLFTGLGEPRDELISTTGMSGIDPQFPVFAVLGRTGVGKSSFIATLGGRNQSNDEPQVCRGLETCTKDVKMYRTSVNGTSIYLMDTPRFDDTELSDRQVMEMIYNELQHLYRGEKLVKGLIYLHNINEARVGGLAARQFRAFEQLLGVDRFQHLSFVTTKWPTSAKLSAEEYELLTNRENELREKYWNKMISRQARLWRYEGDLGQAQTIILSLMNAPKIQLDLTPEQLHQRMRELYNDFPEPLSWKPSLDSAETGPEGFSDDEPRNVWMITKIVYTFLRLCAVAFHLFLLASLFRNLYPAWLSTPDVWFYICLATSVLVGWKGYLFPWPILSASIFLVDLLPILMGWDLYTTSVNRTTENALVYVGVLTFCASMTYHYVTHLPHTSDMYYF